MLLDQYTEILRKIYGNHLKTVILYGSYARGDYKAVRKHAHVRAKNRGAREDSL